MLSLCLLGTALRSKGLTQRCKCSNYQTLGSLFFVCQFSYWSEKKSNSFESQAPISMIMNPSFGRFRRHPFSKQFYRHVFSLNKLYFTTCRAEHCLERVDSRIARERFRDVDMVPLERIFQTCTFCNSACNGSTDTVLCNMFSCPAWLTFR